MQHAPHGFTHVSCIAAPMRLPLPAPAYAAAVCMAGGGAATHAASRIRVHCNPPSVDASSSSRSAVAPSSRPSTHCCWRVPCSPRSERHIAIYTCPHIYTRALLHVHGKQTPGPRNRHLQAAAAPPLFFVWCTAREGQSSSDCLRRTLDLVLCSL